MGKKLCPRNTALNTALGLRPRAVLHTICHNLTCHNLTSVNYGARKNTKRMYTFETVALVWQTNLSLGTVATVFP